MKALIATPPLLFAVALGMSPLYAPSGAEVTQLAAPSVVDYRPAATVLTLEGTGFPGVNPFWNNSVQGPLCQTADTCTAVDYQSWNPIIPLAIIDGVHALDEALNNANGEKIVLGYSLGALVVEMWLAKNVDNPSVPDPGETTFVTMGNPLNARGGILQPIGRLLPESQYQRIEVIRQYDMLADGQFNPLNLATLANAVAGFLFVHLDYSEVDIDDPGNVTWTEGNITYVFVPTPNVPLLEPLRLLGFDELADQLNEPIKKIIEAGYYRAPEVEAAMAVDEAVESDVAVESVDGEASSEQMGEPGPMRAVWQATRHDVEPEMRLEAALETRLDAVQEKAEEVAQPAANAVQLDPNDLAAQPELPSTTDPVSGGAELKAAAEGPTWSLKHKAPSDTELSAGEVEDRELGKKKTASPAKRAGSTKPVRDRIRSAVAKVRDSAKYSPTTVAKDKSDVNRNSSADANEAGGANGGGAGGATG
ncbi:PE-PPE domain-containing protein, partial [Micromonospora sp. WMMD736]|uniref:PE-PPE domain-containing protein n=1 Tax=Micromonospora sp. WMMD736 TaxID=3404112 RepID=UPI003B93A41C